MNNIRSQIGRLLFKLLPAYSQSLYELCLRYVDRFNGDNNSNSETNGEYIFLRNVLPKVGVGVVFDVGANVGDWASFALGINKNINLYCFEPCKTTYSNLSKKAWPSNVRLNNIGLGKLEGVLELNISDNSGLNSLYIRRGVECVRTVTKEKIYITTIDNYCEKNGISEIDLLKVDVEGHEFFVFKGMKQMLATGQVKVIQFEYGGCNLDAKAYLVDIWEFLEHYRFRFYKLYPEGPRYIEKYRQKLETFKYSNWICVREGFDL